MQKYNWREEKQNELVSRKCSQDVMHMRDILVSYQNENCIHVHQTEIMLGKSINLINTEESK